MLRHDRPYTCKEPNCPRKDGFTSQNDLDRHKKSVHRMGSLDKTFMCAARDCSKRSKVWPREDNFRQHCIRLHPTMVASDLIKSSALRAAQNNDLLKASAPKVIAQNGEVPTETPELRASLDDENEVEDRKVGL